MRSIFAVSRRSTITTTAVLGLSLVVAGAMSTAAYAAEDEPASTPSASVAASTRSDVTIAPFISADAATHATEPFAAVAEEAETTIEKAETAIDKAEAAEKKVAKADVKVRGKKSIDTRTLEEHIDVLETVVQAPALLFPASAETALVDTVTVKKQTVSLLKRLDVAEKKKAAEEAAKRAAAKKKAEAEAAAAREAAEAAEAQESSGSSDSSGSSSGSSGGVSGGSAASSGDNSVAGAKATARSLLGNYGWGSGQFSCLEKLWQKESGWNYRAYNSSSGAYGIPQALPGSKMGSAGSDWKSSAATQIRWGLGYIDGRYGSPCGAWDHSTSVGWY
jgi:hypothetical protein